MKTPAATRKSIALILTLAFSALTTHAADQTATWNGTTGNWSDTTKWSTNPLFPNNGNGGFTFDAVQNAGTLTLDTAVTIQKFTLGGGTFQGAQTLTLNDGLIFNSGTITTSTINAAGASTFTGGIMAGAGTVNFAGGVTFSGTGTKTIETSRVVNIGDAAGTNDALGTWSGGNINLNVGGVLTVKSDATLDTNFDGTMTTTSGTGTFNNQGTFTKSGGTGNTTFTSLIAFNNTGTVNVNTGTLSLNGNNSHSGVWNVASGSTLSFNAGTDHFSAGSSFSGAGTTQIAGATLSINGATTLGTAFSLTSGTVTGAGTLTVSGPATFTGGIMAGAGTVNFAGGVTFSGTGTKTIESSRVVNIGDAAGTNDTLGTWSGGNINLNVGGVLTVKSDATLNTNFDGTMTTTSGTGTFNNQGTFTKSGGTGTTTFTSLVAFNNTGTVNVNSGTLSLAGGVTQHSGTTLSGGTWNVTNGAAINITTGSNITTIGSGASVSLDGATSTFAKVTTALATNQGSFTIKNNRDLTTAGAYANSGTTRVEDSTTVMTIGAGGASAYTQTGPSSVTILSGGAMIDSSAFNLNGGALRGTGTIDAPLTATTANATTIAPGASPGVITINGSTVLGANNTLAMEIGGLASGVDYDLLDVNGVITLGGLLNLTFINGFQGGLQQADLFTIVTSDSAVLGSFSNVANGGLLQDTLGLHTFSVHYGAGSAYNPNNVTLLAITPEPSRALLLMLGLAGLLMRRRRK